MIILVLPKTGITLYKEISNSVLAGSKTAALNSQDIKPCLFLLQSASQSRDNFVSLQLESTNLIPIIIINNVAINISISLGPIGRQ